MKKILSDFSQQSLSDDPEKNREVCMSRTALILIFTLVLSASLSTAAPVPVGEVAAVRGKAEAAGTDKVKRVLSPKALIFSDDTLQTSHQARLQVMFRDNSIISMGPDSEISVEKYSLNSQGGEMKTRIKEGAFHIMGGSIAKDSPDNFVTETPVATIGIRGSMFALNIREDRLSVVFLGGRGIDVFNSSGSVAITNPGFGTVVTGVTEMPEPPRNFRGDELQDILQMTVHDEKEGAGVQDKKTSDGETGQPAVKNRDGQGTRPPGPRPPFPPPPGTRSSDLKPLLPGMTGAMDLSYLPQDAANNIINVNTEYRLNSIVQTDQKFEAKGRQQSVLKNVMTGIAEKNTGLMDAFIFNDHIEGFIINQEGEKSFFRFPVPPGDPSAPYSGSGIIENIPAAMEIEGIEEKPGNLTVGASSTGTFVLFRVDDYGFIRDDNEYLYTEIGFSGLKALQERRFTDGISVFSGYAAGFAEYSDDRIRSSDGASGDFKMMTNWHNNKFFGFVSDLKAVDDILEESAGSGVINNESAPVIMFGDLDPDRPVVKDSVAFGYYNPMGNTGDGTEKPVEDLEQPVLPEPSPVVWLQGGIEGELYGSRFDGFGLLAEGDLVKIQSDQSEISGGFSITAGGFRNTGFGDSSSGTGVIKGFAIGISEDMNAPDRNSRFFMNYDPDDFVMEIDRDTGNINGTMTAKDIKGSGAAISNLEIGGAEISAYIDDTHFAALLGGQNSMTSPDGTVSGLKPYGNYLVTNLDGTRLSEYTSWGYWETSYTEQTAGTERQYHLHLPGDMWIAGQPAPETKMDELKSSGFRGLYEGKAIGVFYNDIGGYRQTENSLSGTSRIEVDLRLSSANQVKGEIGFDARNIILGFQSERISGSTFHAEITNAQGGMVNGAFFGPGADSTAGSFAAKLENGSITGIFGADIKTPAQ